MLLPTVSCRLPPACCSFCPTGQGVNSALEDVCVLERQLFDASAGDLAQALPAFEQQRLPDSAALVKLVQVRRQQPRSRSVSCGSSWHLVMTAHQCRSSVVVVL